MVTRGYRTVCIVIVSEGTSVAQTHNATNVLARAADRERAHEQAVLDGTSIVVTNDSAEVSSTITSLVQRSTGGATCDGALVQTYQSTHVVGTITTHNNGDVAAHMAILHVPFIMAHDDAAHFTLREFRVLDS